MLSKLAVTFSVIATIAQAAVPADLITSLPGWTGALPTPQYSGYLSITGGSNLHYWLVTAQTNSATAPTILWFNGGPGCSSLDGFVYEHGPFEISTDLKLTEREYSWNKIANVLYIEAPVGVGFSYSSTKDYSCNDDRTASENLLAVEKFFELYPEFKNNKFFITGESYAGVYVPTLAEAIIQAGSSYTGAKLTGIAVGNGCSGTEVGICGSGTQGTYYEWSYLIQTAFVDSALKASVNQHCNWTAAYLNDPNALSLQCVSLLNQASAEIQNVNMYNIYGDCVNAGSCGLTGDKKIGKIPARAVYEVRDEAGSSRKLARITPSGPDACIDSAVATAWLSQASVQQAIHVTAANVDCFTVCGTARGWSYSSTRTNLPKNTYPLLIANIQVVIFNGDWDACVPFTDGEGWTSGMGLPVKKAWHPWTYTSAAGATNQVAGYATGYSVSGGSFEFVTVKGGRHEVPETAPAQAMELLDHLINKIPF